MTPAGDEGDDDRAFEERVDRRRATRLRRFSPDVLYQLALVPSWLEPLARAAGFGAIFEDLDALERAGLIERREAPGPDDVSCTHAWMLDPVRADVLAALRADEPTLLHFSRETGRRILDVRERHPALLSPALAVWAELAAAGLEAPDLLRRAVRERVREERRADAAAWIDAARYLEPVVGPALAAARVTAERRLELAWRRDHDERVLASFLERREQIDAFLALLAAPDNSWAVHFVGAGGAGKTMLLRYLTARLAPNRGATVARIDFDHLSPDYPARRPGQLLSVLADELLSQLATEHQQRLLDKLRTEVAYLDELASREGASDMTVARERALLRFADLLETLPQPVILLLDTCEELAKVEPDTARLPALEATFTILELLHTRLPRLRVIFAGRRYLARSGDGWELPKDRPVPERERLSGDMPYLRVLEIRGFDEDEVDDYLGRIMKLSLSAGARAAILARSADPSARPGEVPRYNPFDVALYADWIAHDPSLDLAVLGASSVDPYVEVRIVKRLENAVATALPALVLLRRFDGEAVHAAVGEGEDAGRVFRLLREQEWIDYVSGPDETGGVLEIHKSLLPRLCAYYEHPSKTAERDAAAARIGPALEGIVRARALSALSVDALDAALRCLPPRCAAALWEDMERRVVDEAAFGWAVNVTERLLGEDGAAGAAQSPLRAAVRATRTSALLHQDPGTDLGAAWVEVAKTSVAHPDPAAGERLRDRAVAGQVAAISHGAIPTAELFAELWNVVDRDVEAGEWGRFADERSATLCAAVAAALDDARARALIEGIDRWPERIARWSERIEERGACAAIATFAHMLAGKAAAGDRRWKKALSHFILAQKDRHTPSPRAFLDWVPPDPLIHRVRLEAQLSGAYDRDPIPEQHLRTLAQEAQGHLPSVEAERLISHLFSMRLARGLVPREELPANPDPYDPDRRPRCAAHRAVPPLFVTLALAHAALGDPASALSLLEKRSGEATTSGRDAATVRDAEHARLAIARRYRMPGEPLVEKLASGDVEDRITAWAVLVLCDGGAPAWPDDRLHLEVSHPLHHAFWRCQPLSTASDPQAARSAAKKLRESMAWPVHADPLLETALALDRAEMETLAPVAKPHVTPGDLPEWWREDRLRAEDVARLVLRRAALAKEAKELDALVNPGRAASVPWHDWLAAFPRRRLAELALDEGELLALRAPERGRRLLNAARRWFFDAQDPVGSAMAAIAGVTAAARIGQALARAVLAGDVKPAYEELLASGLATGLPTWEQLRSKAESGALEALPTGAWSAWEVRLLTCLAHSQAPKDGSARRSFFGFLDVLAIVTTQAPKEGGARPSAKLRDLLRARFGAALPPELSFLDSPRELPMSQLVWIFVGVFAALVVYGLWRLLKLLDAGDGWLQEHPLVLFDDQYTHFQAAPPPAAPHRLLPAVISFPAHTLHVTAAVLLILFFAGKLGNTWRGIRRALEFLAVDLPARVASLVSPSKLTFLRIEPAKAAASGREHARLELGTARLTSDLDALVDVARVQLDVPSARDPYAKVAADLLGGAASGWDVDLTSPVGNRLSLAVTRDIAKALVRLEDRVLFRTQVSLTVARPLAHLPWEAYLRLAMHEHVRQKKGIVVEALHGRLQLCRPAKGSAAAAWNVGKGLLVAGFDFLDLVERAPESFQHIGARSAGPAGDGFGVPEGTGVVHFVGTAVRTTAGMRLDARGPGASGSRERLIGPNDDPLMGRIVIVQGAPVDVAERSGAERQEAADLRELAADYAAAGAWAVLFVPAMPRELVAAALRPVSRALFRRSAPTTANLRDMADDVRRAIAGKPDADRRELGLDVCLFIGENRR